MPILVYQITYTPSAAKQLRKLDRQTALRILNAIGKLGDDPRPSDCIRLVGGEGELRIRVGDYRVVYEVVDEQIIVLVLRIGHRSQVYR